MKHKSKIMIVDGHPVVRDGLAHWIREQPGLTVCCQASNAAESLEQLAVCLPNLIISGLLLPNTSGLDFVRDVSRRYPGLPILIFSAHDERLYARRALQAGAKGFVMKDECVETVLTAIRRTMQGDVYLSPCVNAELLNALAVDKARNGRAAIETLSDRELEVYRLLGDGLTTRAIAGTLFISVSTVQSYYERLKIGLNLKNLAAVRHHAILWRNENKRA
jgi:DNA-binding NarL/FixJ family response regulator